MYNVLDVCRYVINYSNDKNYGISNLKLQKLLYFIQAFFIKCTSDICFREKIEAWEFGPVVPEAYREYKQYGSGNIPRISAYVEINNENIWNSKVREYNSDIIKEDDKQLINMVIDGFADYTATDLVEITHNQSPWIESYVPYMNNEITPQMLKEYFDE